METALNPTRLVGLGSMFGAILETSGGAQSIAVTMVKKFGDEKAVWALGITGLVIAMPVFCACLLYTSKYGERPRRIGRKIKGPRRRNMTAAAQKEIVQLIKLRGEQILFC